jgi:prolyl-tRNA editing enzyme YbaK/EbsC (Cys-tRNA(Pro) deacylase)
MDLKQLEERLKRKKVKYRLIKLRKRAVSSREVAKYAEDDVKEDQVCKTIVLRDEKGSLLCRAHPRIQKGSP